MPLPLTSKDYFFEHADAAFRNARWALNGSLIMQAQKYIPIALLEAMRSCFRGKVILFVGDSMFKSLFWAAVHWLCRLMQWQHCSNLPPHGFAQYRCTKFVAYLGDDLVMVYYAHRYGANPWQVLTALNLTADLVIYNSGIWFDADNKSETFILDSYRKLFTEAVQRPDTALLAAHTMPTASRHSWKYSLRRVQLFNDLLDQAFQEATQTQQHHITLLRWDFALGNATQHLQSDRVHPLWHTAILYAQIVLQSASHAMCRGPITFDLAIDQDILLKEPRKPEGYYDQWCNETFRTAHPKMKYPLQDGPYGH